MGLPLFVDAANKDFHLKAESPCINAGDNTFVSTLFDIEGNARIKGGRVDMGAYESLYSLVSDISALNLLLLGRVPGN